MPDDHRLGLQPNRSKNVDLLVEQRRGSIGRRGRREGDRGEVRIVDSKRSQGWGGEDVGPKLNVKLSQGNKRRATKGNKRQKKNRQGE